MEKHLSEISVVEIEALCYRQIATMEQARQTLALLQEELKKRAEPVKQLEVANGVEEEATT